MTTQKGDKLYVHILDLQDKVLFLPLEGKKVKKAVRFADRVSLKFQKSEKGIVLYLPDIPTAIDTVVELQLAVTQLAVQ